MPHATNNLMRKAMPLRSYADGQETFLIKKATTVSKHFPNSISVFNKAGYPNRVPAFFLACLGRIFSQQMAVKMIALTLVGCVLFSSVAPSYAQGMSAVQRARQQRWGQTAIPSTNSALLQQNITKAILSQQDPHARARKMIHAAYGKWIESRSTRKVLEGCEQDLFQAGVYEDHKAFGKEICDENGCVGAEVYGRACVQIGLDLAQAHPQENAVLMDTAANRFDGVDLRLSQLISLVGASAQEVERAYQYEENILQSKGVCEQADAHTLNSSVWGKALHQDGSVKQPKAGACAGALAALEGIAVLGVMHPHKYSARAARTIYDFMLAKKRKDFGVEVEYTGAMMLLGLNTDQSYKLLEKFLVSDSKQSVVGRGLEVIGYAFPEGWVQAVQEAPQLRLNYLNSYTARYNYLDTELSNTWKMYCRPQAVEDVRNEIQCPEGNLYEDLGGYIAEDGKRNPRSAALANKIWEGIKQGGHRHPMPLLVGLLTGSKGAWTYEYGQGGSDAQDVLEFFTQADFLDVNEGTQRRIRQKVYDAQAAHLEMEQPRPQGRDEAKFLRYQRERRIHHVAAIADWIWLAVGLGSLTYNLGVKGVRAVVGRVRQAGKVSAGTQAAAAASRLSSGVETTGKSVRAANQASHLEITATHDGQAVARSLTQNGTVEFKLRTKTPALAGKAIRPSAGRTSQIAQDTQAAQLVTSGGHAPQYNARAVGQAIGPKEPATTVSQTVKTPARYKQGLVTNSLNQQVSGWVPVQPQAIGPKPSAWKLFRESTFDSLAEGWYSAKQIGREITAAFKHRTLNILLASHLTFTPMLSGITAAASYSTRALAATEMVAQTGTGLAMTVTDLGRGVALATRGAQSAQNSVRLAQLGRAVRTAQTGAETVHQTGSNLHFGAFFLPAVATSNEIRRFGRAFDTKQPGAPQWQQQYRRDLDRYAVQIRQAYPQLSFKTFGHTQGVLQAYRQQQQIENWQARQRHYYLNLQSVFQQPWNLPLGVQHAWDAAYLSYLAPVFLRKNPGYQAAITQTTSKSDITGDVWGKELFFSEDILQKFYQAELAFLNQQQPVRSPYALGFVPHHPLMERFLQNRRNMHQAMQERQQLMALQPEVWQQFSTNYKGNTTSVSLLDPVAVKTYHHLAVNILKRSNLHNNSQQLIQKAWKEQVARHLQSIHTAGTASKLQTKGIPVYDEKGQLLTYWNLDQETQKYLHHLHENQTIFIVLSSKNVFADMFVRAYHNKDHTKYTDTLLRSDIEIQLDASVQKPTLFGWKKIVEGILLVNNRLLPLYGVYLMAGMGNVSSTISNFSKIDFSLANWQMYAMGGISSVVMGLVSFVAGILQNRWARNPDGTVNGTHGRNRTMNIGMSAFVAGMIVPMLGGMMGQLGDPTDLKKYLIFGSFAFLGIGAAFMDVSMKPVVLAASRRGDYQANQGYLSVFKQTVGNAGNYLIPPIAMAIMSLFGKQVDWTVFFPIYGALGLGIMALYNFSNMHQQTLGHKEVAREEDRLSLKTAWKELTGKQNYNRIIRHGVAATALHGLNMGILGLHMNQLFQKHVGGNFNMYASAGSHNVFQAVWESLSNSWLGQSLLYFTVPIILGRLVGTYLMKHDIRIGSITIPRLNNGSLLMASAAMVIGGVALVAFGPTWSWKVGGVVMAALGLTNISPIVGAYTADRTRHVSDAVSTMLSATAILTFPGNILFGWFRDLTERPELTDQITDLAAKQPDLSWLPLLMPVACLVYLGYFGWEIFSKKFDKAETVAQPVVEEPQPKEEIPGLILLDNGADPVQATPVQTENPVLTQAAAPAPANGLSAVKKAVRVADNLWEHFVWELKDTNDKTIGFAKFGSYQELARTRRFQELAAQYQQKYPLLKISYPEVLAEGLQDLPTNIRHKIERDAKRKNLQKEVRDFEKRSQVAFIMSTVDVRGITLLDTFLQQQIGKALRGKKVTVAEWKQVLQFFDDLHAVGLYHTDLLHNLHLSRATDGKLQLALLDFELFETNDDIVTLNLWRNTLLRENMMEYVTGDLLSNETTDGMQLSQAY